MKKVILIDNYDSFTFNLAQLLKESKLCTLLVVKNKEVKLEEIQEYDKILFSPGPGKPHESKQMFEILKQYETTKSILGICLGMQAIAEFYGAELFNLNMVYNGITTHTKIVDSSDCLFRNLPERIETGLYHSWAVKNESIPKRIQITALSQDNIIMGISHKIFDVKGLQFHPESVMTPSGSKIIQNWLLC
jgi:anthranilate synthase component 2